MNNKSIKQMAKMVDAVQPSCNDKVTAAMTCSLAGTMESFLISRALGGLGAIPQSVKLPNPVFIAVGEEYVYAFEYAPKGFGFKIKKEVARWPKGQLTAAAERKTGMVNLVLAPGTGEHYGLEIPIMMGGKEVVEMFVEALGTSLN